jgi:hypothetical protein
MSGEGKEETMKLEAKATVLAVGGRSVTFLLTDGRVAGSEVSLSATPDEQRAWGALLYTDVTITVTATTPQNGAGRK